MKKLLVAWVLLFQCLAIASDHLVTLCPDDASAPDDECMTLNQLKSNHSFIQPNTTIKFVPATFKVQSDTVINIENVSNLIIETGSPNRAFISCIGNNSGFIFRNISGLAIKNVIFSHCGMTQRFLSCSNDTFTIAIIASASVVLNNISFQHGEGGGVFGENIFKHLTISNALFTYMQGTCLCLMYNHHSSSADGTNKVKVSSSKFISNYYLGNGKAWAMNVAFADPDLPIQFYVVDVVATNNTHRDYTSGVYISSNSLHLHQNHIIFERYSSNNNVVLHSTKSTGSSDFLYQSFHKKHTFVYIEIIDCNFVNNIYKASNDVDQLFINVDKYNFLLFISTAYSHHLVTIKNTAISNNTGKYGAAVLASGSYHYDFKMNFINSKFTYNSISSSLYDTKGIVAIYEITGVTFFDCSFVGNTVKGLFIRSSNVDFGGTNHFRGNRAYNGGGIAMYWKTMLTLLKGAKIIFEDNVAENVGGGIYFVGHQCLSFVIGADSALEFKNNSARIAGNDFYGAELENCLIKNKPAWLKLTKIVHSPQNYTLDVTSDPLRVCECSAGSTQDCIKIKQTIKIIHTYPGKNFNLTIMAVGQLLNTSTLSGVPSNIYATILPQTDRRLKAGVIPDVMENQSGKRVCSNITYRVNSANEEEVMTLATRRGDEYFKLLWLNHTQWHDNINGALKEKLVIPAYVKIHFLPCPTGFELSSDGACVCATALENIVISCSIDTMLIKRKPSIWLGTKPGSDPMLYIHQQCPYDYCKSGEFEFSLNDVDTQCAHNRSGILCGACKPGYSMILGGTECRRCSNIYLLLLIPFGVAGIFLIVFLSLTDMTVAAGTINGLLFYANIVIDNATTFFPAHTSQGFLPIFIAWLNLDIGISTCFFDGLNAYGFTWLQFAFPVYIWLLAAGIILACRHFDFMNRLCGSNIVQVLATLFLLSYSKLQTTIATSLSFTVVKVSNGEKMFVWLKNANIPYLEGKHIALFLFSLIMLCVFLVYTLSIVLGPLLQRKTQYRVFCWVLKFKPLFDAYFGPLKDQHRYWTGVLLLFRIVLSLVSAMNVFGDDSINLLAIVFVSMLLLWWSGSVYKCFYLSLLDGFFLMNLGLLASLTLFSKLSYNGNKPAIMYVSTGSAFAAFCAILLYHCIKRFKKIRARQRSGTDPIDDVDSDDDMLDIANLTRNWHNQ